MPHRSALDIAKIPAVESRNLGSTFLTAVMRYFDSPEHLSEFEEWKRERDMQEAVSH